MKKICIITTIHPQYDARIFERTIVPLFENGYEVSVIAPWKPHPDYSGIRWIELPVSTVRLSRILNGFYAFLKSLKVDSAVLHFHDLDFMVWAVLIKLISGKKIIYDCHENYAEEILYGKPWIPKYLRVFLSKMTVIVEKLSSRFFDQIVAVVPNQVDRFSEISKNVILIRNLSVYKPYRELIHEKNIIYIGSISENYGGEALLNLARALKKHGNTLKIISFDKFDATYKPYFTQCINQENLPIFIQPRFNRDQILEIMSKGCIGLSFSEDTISNNLGFPTKLFEYMSFGIPVIASNTIRHQQIMNFSKSGILVNDKDIENVYSTVNNLIENKELLGKLKENGFYAIESEYNWNLEKQKLIDVYERLLR
jgi:glycosyltransferase involved in cell wall biosynthesis